MNESRDPSPAVSRALRILEALEAAGGTPQTLSDIARAVGIAKSSASNICAALERERMIHRAGNGYRLGMRTAELGGAFASQFNQVREFFAVIEEDAELAGQLVQIATLDAPDALYLARHEGRAHRLGAPLGSRLPLVHCAVGNAMLMVMAEAEVEALLEDLPILPRTPRSAREASQIREKIAAARERGYAIDRGESFEGICGVAAPLEPWQPGDPLMAMGVAIPAAEADEETVARLGEAVARAAGRLSNPLARRPGVHA